MNEPKKEEKNLCPQCSKPILQPVTAMIIYRTNREVKRENMTFCSSICGSHYQMGCEG